MTVAQRSASTQDAAGFPGHSPMPWSVSADTALEGIDDAREAAEPLRGLAERLGMFHEMPSTAKRLRGVADAVDAAVDALERAVVTLRVELDASQRREWRPAPGLWLVREFDGGREHALIAGDYDAAADMPPAMPLAAIALQVDAITDAVAPVVSEMLASVQFDPPVETLGVSCRIRGPSPRSLAERICRAIAVAPRHA